MWKVVISAVFVSLAVSAPTDSDVTKLDYAPVNEFSLRLLDNTFAFQEIFGRQNFAISPVSAWSLFALLTEGSSGETFQELKKALRIPADLKSTQALHRGVDQILKRGDKDVTLNSTTAIFSECSIDINPEFCAAALTYDIEVTPVDISNATKLADDINYYICVMTESRIKNVVKPEYLEDLKMLVLDALYFKANWTYRFDASKTKQEVFYDSVGKVLGSVNMMYSEGRYNVIYPDSIQAEVLEMTYGQNNEFSMMVLLPFEGVSLKKLIHNLASQPVTWMNEFKSDGNELQETEVYLPRFTVSSQVDLITPMKYTGIDRIFDSHRAELPGVSSTPLYVSKALQSVDIEVTEAGTIASSSTVIGLETRFGTQRFEVNKEFVFLIVERRSNVILFAGVYDKPSLV